MVQYGRTAALGGDKGRSKERDEEEIRPLAESAWVTKGKAMWDEQKRARFQALRQREEEGTLTEAEQAQLAQLIHEIERAEEAYLRPATERLRAERLETEAQNAALRRLIKRREKLVQRLRKVLAEADAEQHAITEEVTRILSGSNASSGTPH